MAEAPSDRRPGGAPSSPRRGTAAGANADGANDRQLGQSVFEKYQSVTS